MQHVIYGDAFLEVEKLAAERVGFDLVVFDPPYGLDELDLEACLQDSWAASTADAVLVWYCLNPGRVIRMISGTDWKTTRLFQISRDDVPGSMMGWVVYATKSYNNRNYAFLEYDQSDTIWVEGEKDLLCGDGVTGKPEEWFTWILSPERKWDHVLDPFAGLAPVGRLCKKLGVHYTGIELDGKTHRAAVEGIR